MKIKGNVFVNKMKIWSDDILIFRMSMLEDEFFFRETNNQITKLDKKKLEDVILIEEKDVKRLNFGL